MVVADDELGAALARAIGVEDQEQAAGNPAAAFDGARVVGDQLRHADAARGEWADATTLFVTSDLVPAGDGIEGHVVMERQTTQKARELVHGQRGGQTGHADQVR